MRVAAVVLVLLFAARSVIAAPTSGHRRPQKSATLATALALGGTAAGLGLLIAGANTDEDTAHGLYLAGGVVLAIAPASGHAYAGDWRSAGVTAGLRGAVVGFAALRPDLLEAPCLSSFCDHEHRPHADSTGALALAVAATIAYDIFDAGRAAHRANLEGIQFQPLMTPILEPPTGGPITGLSVGGAF